MVRLTVDGTSCDALVDTGCTQSIAHVSMCSHWKREDVSVMTVSGKKHRCEGTGMVCVQLRSGASAFVEVLVSTKPMNFSFILGMDVVTAFRGVTVRTPNDVQFGADNTAQALGNAQCGTDDSGPTRTSAVSCGSAAPPCRAAAAGGVRSPLVSLQSGDETGGVGSQRRTETGDSLRTRSAVAADCKPTAADSKPTAAVCKATAAVCKPTAVSGLTPDSGCSTIVEEKDYVLTYDAAERRWTVTWKWSGSEEPVNEHHYSTGFRRRPSTNMSAS